MNDQLNTTDWFPGNIKPVRTGVYRTDVVSMGTYQFWNGMFWGSYAANPEKATTDADIMSAYQSPRWCGLSADPSAPVKFPEVDLPEQKPLTRLLYRRCPSSIRLHGGEPIARTYEELPENAYPDQWREGQKLYLDPREGNVEFTDKWTAKHSMSLKEAAKMLKEFHEAWPGGLSEIDSALRTARAMASPQKNFINDPRMLQVPNVVLPRVPLRFGFPSPYDMGHDRFAGDLISQN